MNKNVKIVAGLIALYVIVANSKGFATAFRAGSYGASDFARTLQGRR